MNEQLQAELLKIVTKINSGSETFWGFLTDQTPDVIRQLLLWYGVKSFLLHFIPLLTLGCSLIALWFLWSKTMDSFDNDEITKHGFGFILSCTCAFCSFFTWTISANLTWLQIWIAPKVWLLEYIKKIAT
jgi:hypothetical protein